MGGRGASVASATSPPRDRDVPPSPIEPFFLIVWQLIDPFNYPGKTRSCQLVPTYYTTPSVRNCMTLGVLRSTFFVPCKLLSFPFCPSVASRTDTVLNYPHLPRSHSPPLAPPCRRAPPPRSSCAPQAPPRPAATTFLSRPTVAASSSVFPTTSFPPSPRFL